jgi:hypothetical protein
MTTFVLKLEVKEPGIHALRALLKAVKRFGFRCVEVRELRACAAVRLAPLEVQKWITKGPHPN